jgi:hypothetical protein
LLQQRHAFKAALLDLDALIAADPGNAQARLTRATVKLVVGEPAAARGDCGALIGRAGFVAIATCLGAADAATGRAATALDTLEQAISREPNTDAETLRWAETQAAGMAEQLGKADKAQAHYAAALQNAAAAGQNDVYLKAAYADFLLAAGKPAEVQKLLKDDAAFDALLLRLALAEQALAKAGDVDAKVMLRQHQNDLAARFALAETRGDAAHTREMARMAVMLEQDSGKALKLALRNWEVQRESADAEVFLQAALLAHDNAAAQPVLSWMKSTGIQDLRLKPLVEQLGGQP